MKTTAATLVLIATLWNLIPLFHSSETVPVDSENPGGINTLADPPDDGGLVIIQPPPRQ